MRKFSRLLYIINTLRYKHCLRAEDIARECEVNVRTFYRDLNALVDAGVPVYYDRGYKLLNNTFLPPLQFSPDEILYIYCGLSNNIIPDGIPHENIRKKILAKLSGTIKNVPQIADNPDAISVYPRVTSKPNMNNKIFRILCDAITDFKSLEIDYESLHADPAVRLINPYSLVFRGRSWYLIAYCHKREEIRTFRLNRIRSANPIERRFRRLSGYSVRRYFEDRWDLFGGEIISFTAIFRGLARKVILSGVHHPSEKIKIIEGGDVFYSAKASGKEDIMRWLIGFGDYVEVTSPPALIDEIKQHLRRTLKVYGERSV